MFPNAKLIPGVVGSVFIAVASMTTSASAISADVAKKCDALTAKAFPSRVIGNPAAGTTKGTPSEERAYFEKCVANEGKAPDQTK